MVATADDKRTLWNLGPAPVPSPAAQREVAARRRTLAQHQAEQRKRAQQTAIAVQPAESIEFGDRFEDGSMVPGTRYRVRRFLGDGGMGQVYEAEHVDLERPVALKVLLPALGRAPDALAMFRREARTASKLGAEQIVQVFDFAELADKRLMFAMELLDGPTLADLCRDGPVPAPRVTAILRQVCKGLAAAHEAGVVHRDIKPENIVLVTNRDGRPDTVKILDFGISTILDDESADSTVSAGTPYYLAPEFIAGSEFDGRMDQYALGCTAYEMLVGHPPFVAGPGEGVLEILAHHLDDEPPPMRPEGATMPIPAGLQRVVMRCLAKDPDARYPGMAALEAALCEAQIDAKLLTSWDDLALPQDIDPELRDRLLRKMPDPHAPPARHGRTLLFGAVAVALGAGAMYWTLTRDPESVEDQAAVDAAATQAQAPSVVDALVADAKTAAARTYFVMPSADEPDQATAYRKVRALEQLEGPDKTAAQEQAQLLRKEFAATLVRLGDQYWEREGGREFAVDYYRQALVFVRAEPVAGERAELTPKELSELEAKAAAGNFTEQELLDAEPLVALAEPDDDKRRKKIKALRKRRKSRGAKTDRATDQLLAVGSAPAVPDPVEDAGETSATALAKTARSAMGSGKLDQAQMFFDRALTFDVDNRSALGGLFDLELRRGNPRAAIGYAQRLVGAHPGAADGHLRLGDAYNELGSLPAARSAYAKATALGSKKAKKRLARIVAQIGPEPTPDPPPQAQPSAQPQADEPSAADGAAAGDVGEPSKGEPSKGEPSPGEPSPGEPSKTEPPKTEPSKGDAPEDKGEAPTAKPPGGGPAPKPADPAAAAATSPSQ